MSTAIEHSLPILEDSDDAQRIEYLLHLSTGSSKARIVNIWNVVNPHVAAQFERLSADSMIVESWINTLTLDNENTVHDICQRGFKIGEKGLPITTGLMDLSQRAKNNRYEALLCQVATGKPYCVETEKNDPSNEKFTIPDGYDSVYVCDGENSISVAARLKEMEADRATSVNFFTEDDPGHVQFYRHKYMLADGARIMPCFLVQFEYDPEAPQGEQYLCDACGEANATVYCAADSAKLCPACDREVHAANKLVARHVRVPIKEHPLFFGTCPHHPDMTVEYFCPTCQEPVCVKCKMEGNHSAGESATHRLVSVHQAYEKAMNASGDQDPLLDARRDAIREHLKEIDERLRDVYKNSASVEEMIYRQLQQILYRLQEKTQSKLNTLLGEEIEMRRQLSQIHWLDQFLSSQREHLTPVRFLHLWRRHQQMRAILHDKLIVKGDIDVEADLRLTGDMDVTEGNFTPAGLFDQPHSGVGQFGEQQWAQPTVSQDIYDPQPQPGLEDGDAFGFDDFKPAPSASAFRATLFQRNKGKAKEPTPQAPARPFDPTPTELPNTFNQMNAQDQQQGKKKQRVLFSALKAMGPNHPAEKVIARGAGASETASPIVRRNGDLWAETMKNKRQQSSIPVEPAASSFPEGDMGYDTPSFTAQPTQPAQPETNPMWSSQQRPAPMAREQQEPERDEAVPPEPVEQAFNNNMGMIAEPTRPEPVQEPMAAADKPSRPDMHRDASETRLRRSRGPSVSSLREADSQSAPHTNQPQSGAMSHASPSPSPSPDQAVRETAGARATARDPANQQQQRADLSEVFRQYSLRRLAEETRSMMEANQVTLTAVPFADSHILSSDESKQVMYFSLPIASRVPSTKLLWADWKNGRDMGAMHAVVDDNGSTVILARVGEHIFGGFASAPWRSNGVKTGSAKCCLFSLTEDVFIPSKLALCPPGTDREQMAVIYHKVTPMQALVSNDARGGSYISFGGPQGDLVFADDFTNCSSRLEQSYSLGVFEPTSEEAGTLLAGTPVFTPDEIEVWNFVKE
ncbi:hypothetical protein J8273_6871 [Carpediemonas membranifera]|uniref:B-box zinc finger n=1 Tax=Carpediemonas membranifera TaxID=201153 RepID=A0A8J6AR65_9EUKA|nr:hypothetical protein J8273_6871 [Carpediemonas membranifera]|eukprot:KAG9391858.1 hypothetical protein J8273_6871 [Carpediemonas membranifera]